MNSSMIGKIQKAKRYAQERDRICISEFVAQFRGEHDNYVLTYKDNRWHCTCHFFSGWGVCSHTMAMERILADMLPKSDLADQDLSCSSAEVAS
ncbi:MAG: hypothetical protein HYX94_05035 [Chloroflexi bacterium]|nr:hypothetical protein [Chloroflexota bacterium]